MPQDEKKAAKTISRLQEAAKNEPIAKFLGMKLLELTPGYAKVTMKLKPEHQNFNGYVFGGIVAAIADQAFAYGSNSLNHPSIAVEFHINLVSAPEPNDELTAECKGRECEVCQDLGRYDLENLKCEMGECRMVLKE